MNQEIQLEFFLLLFVTTFPFAQTSKTPVDYLKVPGPISLDKWVYNLSWSSHPSSDYYKEDILQRVKMLKNLSACLVSELAYGGDIDKFLPVLKAHRMDVLNAIGAFQLPEIYDCQVRLI